MSARARLLRSALDVLWYSQLHRLLERRWSGVGAVLMLHHVRPRAPDVFAPNAMLEITPEFLEVLLETVHDAGFECVSLDALVARLEAGEHRGSRCLAVTLDDGYRDNLDYAAPVFARYAVPYTVYVTTGITDRNAVLWWSLFEQTLRERDVVLVARDDAAPRQVPCATPTQAMRVYEALYAAWLAGDAAGRAALVARFVHDNALDPAANCAELGMDWVELAQLAAEPLCTIGAHTQRHPALSTLDADAARTEMTASRTRLEAKLGVPVRHFAYPYGDRASAAGREFDLARECGFASAVTTRKGMLFADHASHLHALPRVSINGDYQRRRYPRLLLGGAPFALWNRFRTLDVA